MKRRYSFILVIVLFFITFLNVSNVKAESDSYKIDLTNLTYTLNNDTSKLKTYSQDDFETFLADYQSNKLPQIYVTEFLFDGVSMVKTYDLDDFIESGNEVEVENLEITAININTSGNIEFSGKLTGGMIAIDTNNKTEAINIILNNVTLDTDSKKVPAIYVYNKDITYTNCKVTIKTTDNSKNYVEGGKFKKVSLIPTEELSNYESKYSGNAKTNYTSYTNYYGVYTKEQINNVLFAKVEADSEGLAEGDPYYFYKGAGAISSDIDLYFEGTGYLEVTSKNKEGIETKGNLTLDGGTGDYVINSEDDCLNTTTKSSISNARNEMIINVNSLIAIVDASEDSEEGDAIDSNGKLTINGGTIIAIAHPGQDAGLDSEAGTYINGGTILATGDMFDQISDKSTQNYIALTFKNSVQANDLITLINSDDKAIMAYKTDRQFTTLVYSSADLTEGTYLLYKGGEITGTDTEGFYTNITKYVKGTKQGYSNAGGTSNMMQPGGGMQGGGERNEKPDDTNFNMTEIENDKTPLQKPEENGETSITQPEQSGETPPQKLEENGNMTQQMPEKIEEMDENKENMQQMGKDKNMQPMTDNDIQTTQVAEFEITGIANQYRGIADYTESSESSNKISQYKYTIINISIIAVFVIVLIILIIKLKKSKK